MKFASAIFFIAVFLWNCAPKTETNSRYSNEIAELKNSFTIVDSNYRIFEGLNLDTISGLTRIVNANYKKIKDIYPSTEIDTNYEKTMLIARGQFTKKSPKTFAKKAEIEKEFDLSAKNYSILKENLITENLDEKKSMLYYFEEKNALMILNAEIVSFVEDVNNTIRLSSVIIPQMDSIILVHDNQ